MPGKLNISARIARTVSLNGGLQARSQALLIEIKALSDGINRVLLAIGLFGRSEVLFMARQTEVIQTAEEMKIPAGKPEEDRLPSPRQIGA